MKPDRKIPAAALVFGLLALVVAAGWLIWGMIGPTRPDPDPNQPYARIHGHRLALEIADSPAAHVQGLSGRPSLDPRSGMLFVFKDKQVRTFWMKEMHFALDILWLQDDEVVHLSRNLPPEGRFPLLRYHSRLPVNRVLEINAGLADRYGIRVGDRIELHR